MAITEAYANTESITTTEWSLTGDDSSLDTITTAGVYQVFLDVSDMVSGDELQIRIYEKVRSADTQRVVYQSNLVGPQSPPIWVSPSLVLMNGWDVSLDQIAGTSGITVTWSIRKVA
jgi:hypothetical protein